MTKVIVLQCQRLGEKRDDYFVGQVYTAFRGKVPEKYWAMLGLQLRALEELFETDSTPTPDMSRGFRSSLSDYRNPESVYKDLALYDYGKSPFTQYLFKVMDSFAVIGILQKTQARAGFVLDFYKGKPTKTFAFAHDTSEKVVKTLARAFRQKANDGGNAYLEIASGTRNFNVQRYGWNEKLEARVVEGMLTFGGQGRPQGTIAQSLMKTIERGTSFTPEHYLIKSYDFPINLAQGKRHWQHEMQQLGQVVNEAFNQKLTQANV